MIVQPYKSIKFVKSLSVEQSNEKKSNNYNYAFSPQHMVGKISKPQLPSQQQPKISYQKHITEQKSNDFHQQIPDINSPLIANQQQSRMLDQQNKNQRNDSPTTRFMNYENQGLPLKKIQNLSNKSNLNYQIKLKSQNSQQPNISDIPNNQNSTHEIIKTLLNSHCYSFTPIGTRFLYLKFKISRYSAYFKELFLQLTNATLFNNEDYTRYEGAINNEIQPEGEGILFNKLKKEQFEGSFKNGLKNGKIIHKLNELIQFEGEYENDAKNGEGTLYIYKQQQQSQIFKGKFNNNRKDGLFQIQYFDGSETQLKYYQYDKEVQQRKGNTILQNGKEEILENRKNSVNKIQKFYYNVSLSVIQINSLNEGQWVNSAIIDYTALVKNFDILIKKDVR